MRNDGPLQAAINPRDNYRKAAVHRTTNVTPAGGQATLSLAQANTFKVLLNQNVTLNLSGVEGFAENDRFTLLLEQDDTGLRIVSWWDGILWARGEVPVLAESGIDCFVFVRYGASWLGTPAGQEFAEPA